MIFTTPLGLLALLAIPAIVAIHLFRRRFPVRPVAGLFLWGTVRQTPEGGGRITKLPISRSLILECLAALALALIVAGARISPAGVSQHLVVLLDDSASMAAVGAAGNSARDRAVRRVLAELDRLRAGARITLIRSGDRPAILAGPASYMVEARSALQAWKPEAPHHSMALGLRLARELAGRTGTLMVMSDMPQAPRGETHFEGGVWVALGDAVENVGITAAQRTSAPEDNRGLVSLTLSSNAAAATSRRLSVRAGDREVLAQELSVPPGASSLTLPIPAALPAVRVELSDDGLRRDNDVMLAEPRARTVAVDNLLPEGRGRDAVTRALAAVSGVTRSTSAHLAFVDAAALDPPSASDVWRVGFGRPSSSWLAPGEPKDFIGPFVLEKRHPLLLGVTLGGVVWAGAAPIAAGVVRPVVSTGDQVLAGLATGPAFAARTAILLNIDLDRTNLIRSPDWPILISNLVEMRRQQLPGPERWNYRSGEWVRVRLDRDPKAQLRFRCGAVEHALPAGRLIEFIAPSPGGLLQILDGDEVLFEIGVNFLDETETALRDRSTGDSGEIGEVAGLRTETSATSDPLFWVLLAIGATAMILNWSLLAQPRASRRSLSRSFPT
jgi:von Willebrand factor type A domain/Aerotolerance regulator N-terminal